MSHLPTIKTAASPRLCCKLCFLSHQRETRPRSRTLCFLQPRSSLKLPSLSLLRTAIFFSALTHLHQQACTCSLTLSTLKIPFHFSHKRKIFINATPVSPFPLLWVCSVRCLSLPLYEPAVKALQEEVPHWRRNLRACLTCSLLSLAQV